jgi:transposase
METIVERPAALDVHKAQVTACVRVPDECGRREQHVAEFATTVRGLLALRDWLAGHGVTQVVMEATGVYWKAPWAILEDEFECLLVNARHVKQVPGRKTDVSDAAWLCQLAEAGLLKGSFVPPKPIRQLRNLTRYRKTQIQERAREVNRLHKALEDAGIKLDCVATDILGKSGRDMLDALVRGTTDPDVLADLARRQMRKKIPALREALEGHFDAHHALWVGAILAHVDFLDEQIDRLSDAIEEQIRPFARAVELLCTIVGIQRRGAECILGRDRHRHVPVRLSAAPWRPGPVNAPATTNRPASAARAGPATAPSGWTSRSKRPRWPRSACATATSQRNIGGSNPDAVTRRRSAPSSTR